MGHTNNSSIHKTSRASVPSGKWRWYLQNLALTISNLQCTCGVKPRYPSLVTARAHSLPPLSGFHLLPLSLSLRITDTNACCPTGLSHCLSNHEDTVVLLTCLCWKKAQACAYSPTLILFTLKVFIALEIGNFISGDVCATAMVFSVCLSDFWEKTNEWNEEKWKENSNWWIWMRPSELCCTWWIANWLNQR